ncbi:MAG: type IV pilus modification protein PilV [Moraxellaceae bacterium]|nr:MAG: type IV pilus modification protein PilV [Moraxellaceae bacterium]
MKKIVTQQGATLIEIAITVLILSTSLLAMATLQARSLQFNKGSVVRSQANIFAYDIMDRIRINRGGASANIAGYSADYGAAPTGNTLAVSDVSEWRRNLASVLPEGEGKITCTVATRICTVTIKWSEEQMFGTSTSDSSASLIYSTAI